MRTHRVAAVAALVVCAGAVWGPIPAHAAVSSFYVNNQASGGCSDSTSNSASKPYCTIQAAVNTATVPGDTVHVAVGAYAPFTVTRSGTAAAPITIEGVQEVGGSPAYTSITSHTGVPITVSGASYVNIEGIAAFVSADFNGILVSRSSHVLLDGDQVGQQRFNLTVAGISISGGSSNVTVSRSAVDGYTTSGAVLASGGSGNVITTNYLNNSGGPAIALTGAVSSAVTSNLVNIACGTAIRVTAGSTAASVQNNVAVNVGFASSPNPDCAATSASERVLSVDSSSTSGTIADYNDFAASNSPNVPDVYSWAGADYATAAAFTAATGQGAHDVNSTASDAAIDSANSDAPGELPTDYYGTMRVDDPRVADTGIGTHSYYDRGISEAVDPLAATFDPTSPTLMPVAQSGTFSVTVTDPWGNAITGCSFDFGDGSATATVAATAGGVCAAPHAYAKNGSYTVTVSAVASDGYRKDFTSNVGVDDVSPFTPGLTLNAVGPLTLQVYAAAKDDWSLVSCKIDYGDGTVQTFLRNQYGLGCAPAYTYRATGTYTVTVTQTDAGGNQKSVSQDFVTGGSSFTPLSPQRILDTRKAIGVSTTSPVTPNGVVKLKIAGVDGLPTSGVSAVALNVTVTGTTGGGYITVYPDGIARPLVSNLDFSAGQTVANTVIVQVGADGYIDLANVNSGTTHLVADIEGYYSAGGDSGYHSVTQKRLLDTRATKTPIPAGSKIRLNLGAAYPGINAAMLNLTVVSATGGGYLTVYPDGQSAPITSNLNYPAGSILANEAVVQVGSDGYIDIANSGTGSANVVVDISGYFTPGSGAKFVPITPTRYLDTRSGLGEVYGGYDPVKQAGPFSQTDLDVGGMPLGFLGSIPVPVGTSTTAVAANVTVTQPTAGGYLSVYPSTSGTPTASVLNFTPGQTIQNAVTVGLGSLFGFGDFDVYNGSAGNTQLVVDVFGYYND